MDSATELRHEADKSRPETTSSPLPATTFQPRLQHAQSSQMLPMHPMSPSQMNQTIQKSQPATPVQSSQSPAPSTLPRSANLSVLPPLADTRHVSTTRVSKMSPRPSFSTPTGASANASHHMPSAGKPSAAAPTPAQNGFVSRPPQTVVASSAGSSRAPSVAAPPSTPSTTVPAAHQSYIDTSTVPAPMPETPVPVPVLPPTPATDVPKPKPAYKMKRTGKPGMPPGIPHNYSVPLPSSASNSPSMTPPPPAPAHAQMKAAPKPANSHVHIENPRPPPTVSIKDMIAASSMVWSEMNGSSITAMRPPPKPVGQAPASQSDPKAAAPTEKDKPQPASAVQAQAGDKRENPESVAPDRPQGYGDSSSKRARLEPDDLVVDVLDDESEYSSGEDSEDGADGEGSDDDDVNVVDVDDDEEEGEPSSEDDDNSSSSDSSSSGDVALATKERPGMARVVLPAQARPSVVVTPSKHRALAHGKRRSLFRPSWADRDPEPLRSAPSGRPYNTYTDAFGGSHKSGAIILPDDYKPHDNVSFPWICPIRSCRVAFPEMKGLSHHFPRGHGSQHLNDNLDGTLTVVKQTTTPGGARVVSQKRLADPGPLVTPRLKKQQKRKPQVENVGAASDGYWSESSELSSMSSMPPAAKESTPQAWSSSPKPEELLATPSGRVYTKTDDGLPSHGCAFPDNYKLSSYPDHPWVCPVRSCRCVLKALHNLGVHFLRRHRDCLLNENIDGTHSIVGQYDGRRPMVVSHHSIPVSELAPLVAETPAGGNIRCPPAGTGAVKPRDSYETVVEEQSMVEQSMVEQSVIEDQPVNNGRALVPARHPAQPQHSDLETPIPGDVDTMWQYIAPVLKRTNTRTYMEKSYMHMFFALPRKRDIHWNSPWLSQNPYLDSQPRDVASLVVHLTGDYADEPCDHCRNGKGPYSGCILVSSMASPGLVAAFDSCANCLYHGGHTFCTPKDPFKSRFTSLYPDIDFEATHRYVRSGGFSKDLARGGLAAANRAIVAFYSLSSAAIAAAREEDRKRHRKHRYRYDETVAARQLSSDVDDELSRRAKKVRAERKRRSERIAIKDVIVESYTQSAPPGSQATTPIPITGYDSKTTEQKGPQAAASATTMATTAATAAHGLAAPSSALIFAGAAQPGPEVLEMEDWEVAPGRIDANESTVAYSNAYLTSTQMVPIDHSMSYRVQLVQPGSTMAFPSDAESMRTCSIARGKLRVTVGDAQFVIGPNGLFKVLPGVAFSVENRLYIDACIHITALHV